MLVADLTTPIQFYDRSPLCTYALSRWLGYPISKTLSKEIERIKVEGIYEKQVFFIENLGFCAPTAARKISFEESLRFETVHEETYSSFGYDLIRVAPAGLSARVDQVTSYVLASR